MIKWDWKNVRPSKFRLGQKVWILYDGRVKSFEITRIDATFVADVAEAYAYSGYVTDEGYCQFNEPALYATKKEAVKANHIKMRKFELEKLRSEKNELLIELDRFKRYSSDALEKHIKEVEKELDEKLEELKKLEEDL